MSNLARLAGKVLFFTTSPRTPTKIIPEIKLLHEQFSDMVWNKRTQERFIDALAASSFFEGHGSISDKAFSARDRINRAPKALGFIDLKPVIKLTAAGKELVYGKRPQEIFLRQLLKFQIPSPFHLEREDIKGTFFIKPFLEILRLIRELDYLTFDELKIFALQMTDYRKYSTVKEMILQFRCEVRRHRGEYKRFIQLVWKNNILKIYKQRIALGNIKTRESQDNSIKKFIKTEQRNMSDYADACFRYLRYTGLVSISHKNRSIKIFEDKEQETDFLLATVSREPKFIDNIEEYKRYLFADNTPLLYTDNKDNLIDIIMRIGPFTKRELSNKNVSELKDIRDNIVGKNKNRIIQNQIKEIKSYALYSEIIDTFNEKFYFKPNSRFNDPFTYNIAGVEVALAMAFIPQIEVVNVWKGSPAERAGLQVGDVINEINFTKVFGLTLPNVRAYFERPTKRPLQLTIQRNSEMLRLEIDMRAKI